VTTAGDRVDLVVVGAGHAGCEAALAATRMGVRVVVLTRSADAVARMSCNPAIGGLGKGHLVREVDALGGAMGLLGDATGIQFRRLNLRKGAAVRATRVQSDRRRYAEAMRATLSAAPGLRIVEGEAVAVELEGARVAGVLLADGGCVRARAAVLTTGTFLRGLLHVGLEQERGGRLGEPPSDLLSASLARLGLRLGRLKTGTPCRLDRASLDLDRLEAQPGDEPPPRLSFATAWPDGRPPLPQRSCHLTSTNPRTHEIIRGGLDRSPLYTGVIEGIGPRYCPSIEDKVVRFPDRERHPIFLEPEGVESELVYPNGISTSLPFDLQEALVHSIEGLERARIVLPGYAVEYDYVDPIQLLPSLRAREIEGLFLAGQLNGTSGYEEAAAQGLLAGVNAVLEARGAPPLVLRRDQAYAGVLVDDLVTLGTEEPYRMFTSRAEHRLLLREDNADARLTPIGRRLGLVDDARWAAFSRRQEAIARLRAHLAGTRLGEGGEGARRLEALGAGSVAGGSSLLELLRRPEVGLAMLREAGLSPDADGLDELALEQTEVSEKYAGYIRRQEVLAERLAHLEARRIPADLDFAGIVGLRTEAREKLERHRPLTLGQASRIQGVTPAALALLSVHLKRLGGEPDRR
jgi:tRNA uridine 5-carboxymethylaminomethyl modification enzyme